MPMETSILKSTKKILGIDPTFEAFDLDVLTHINSVFMTLNQLGVGPSDGFMIEDDGPTWVDYLGPTASKNMNAVKSYVYVKVRMLFDPPQTSFHITMMQDQIREMEWRLNLLYELTKTPVDPSEVGDHYVWQLDEHSGFPAEALVGDIGIDSDGNYWRKT